MIGLIVHEQIESLRIEQLIAPVGTALGTAPVLRAGGFVMEPLEPILPSYNLIPTYDGATNVLSIPRIQTNSNGRVISGGLVSFNMNIVAGSSGVTSLNTLMGPLSIVGAGGITVTQTGTNQLTISGAGGGGGGITLNSATDPGAPVLMNPGTGPNFFFKKIAAGTGISLVDSSGVILISSTGSGGGGGGSVSSVTSGLPSVLQITPTTGNVTVTPIGTTRNLNAGLSGTTLAIELPILQGGIASGFLTRTVDLSSLSTGVGGGLTGTSGNGLTVTTTTVSLALATTASAGALRALTGNANDVLRGDGTWSALPPPPSGGVTALTNGLNTTAVNIGGGVWRVDVPLAGSSYVHPTFTPFSFSPSLMGNILTVPAIATNSEGHVTTIVGVSMTLPSSGGGPTGVISFNGSTGAITLQNGINTFVESLGGGAYRVNVPSAGVTSINTLTGALSLVGAGGITVTQTGSQLTISGSGGGGGNITIAPGGSSGIPVILTPGTGSTFTFANIAGAGGIIVSESGGVITISGSGSGGALTGNSGNGLTVTPTTVSLALATTASAGALPALTGFVGDVLRGNGTWGAPPANGVTALVNGTNTTAVNMGGGTWRVDATGAGYSHPNFTAFTFTPTLSGTTLTVPFISTNSEGHVTGIAPIDLTLPASSSVGVTSINTLTGALSLTGAGGITVTQTGSQITVSGSSISYTHPTFTPFAFTPTLVGNQLTVPAIATNNEGHVVFLSSSTMTLPAGGSYTHPTFTPFAFTPTLIGSQLTVPTITTNNEGHVTGISATTLTLPASTSAGVTSINTLTGALSLVGAGNVTVTQIGSQITVSGSSSSYTHPTFMPLAFTPTLVGNLLTLPTITTNNEGHVSTLTATTVTLPTGNNYTHPTFTPYVFAPTLVGNLLTLPNITTNNEGHVATLTATTVTLPTGNNYTHPTFTPFSYAPTLVGNILTLPNITTNNEGHVSTLTTTTVTLPSGNSYTHPTFTPFVFAPSLVGNLLTLPSITTNNEGHVSTLTATTVTLPTGNNYTHPTFTPFTFTPTLAGNQLTLPNITTNNEGHVATLTTTTITLPTGSSYTHPTFTPFTFAPTLVGNLLTLPNITTNNEGHVSTLTTTTVTLPTGSSYTHPTFTPQAFVPTLIGNELKVHAIATNNEGHVTTIIPVTLILPTPPNTGVTSINTLVGDLSLIGAGGITVTQTGSQITVTGSTGGGLTGTSGNGLIVSANDVWLSLATTASAGALRALTGNANDVLRGDGTWSTLSLNGAVTSLVGGTDIATTDLGAGVWRVDYVGSNSNALPPGTQGQTLRHNGLGWIATNTIRSNNNGLITFGDNIRGAIYNDTNSIFFGSWFGTPINETFSVVLANSSGAVFTPPETRGFYVAGGIPAIPTLTVMPHSRRIGFFNVPPVGRQTSNGTIAGLEQCLRNLGLIY